MASLRAQAAGTIACDFMTAEAVSLTGLFVLFFTELNRTCATPIADVAACQPDGWIRAWAKHRTVDRGRSPRVGERHHRSSSRLPPRVVLPGRCPANFQDP